MKPVFRGFLILLLLLGIFFVAHKQPKVPAAAGLEDSIEQLSVGQHISPEYYGLLLRSLRECGAVYESSFVRPVQQAALEDLRAASVHAETAALELAARAPEVAGVQERLARGTAAMLAQLAAWQTEMRVRCGLLGDNDEWVQEAQFPADPVQGYQAAVSGRKCRTAVETAM